MDENELQEIRALFEAALNEKQVEIDHLRAALERLKDALRNVAAAGLPGYGLDSSDCSDSRTLYVE